MKAGQSARHLAGRRAVQMAGRSVVWKVVRTAELTAGQWADTLVDRLVD